MLVAVYMLIIVHRAMVRTLRGNRTVRSPDADGVLPAPPHDATGRTWHHDDELLFEYTKLGGVAAMEVRGGQASTVGCLPFARRLLMTRYGTSLLP